MNVNSLIDSINISFSTISHQLDEINTFFSECDKNSVFDIPDTQKIKIRISLDFCENEYNRILKPNINILGNHTKHNRDLLSSIYHDTILKLSVLNGKLQIVKTKCIKRNCIIYNNYLNYLSSTEVPKFDFNNNNNQRLLDKNSICKSDYDCQLI